MFNRKCSYLISPPSQGHLMEKFWLNIQNQETLEAVVKRCSVGALRNFTKFTGKHLCQSLFFKACNFIKKETLTQVFSCEFWEISKNTFLHRTVTFGDCFWNTFSIEHLRVTVFMLQLNHHQSYHFRVFPINADCLYLLHSPFMAYFFEDILKLKKSYLILKTRWIHFWSARSSRPEVFRKKGVLKNFAKFTGKHLYHSFFFNNVAGTAPAATLFSCEFCEIFNNTYLYRTPLMVASEAQYDSWKRNTVYETLKICEPYQQNLDISWDMIPKRYLLKWII